MNGYRRGAYENMTKDMNNEEKNSNVMHNVKSSDWLSQNFGVRFRYNALGDINTQNIVSSKDSFGITKGVQSVPMHAGSTLAITDPNKAKGIIYMPEHLTHSQKWSHAVDQGIYNGVASTKDLMQPFQKSAKVKLHLLAIAPSQKIVHLNIFVKIMGNLKKRTMVLKNKIMESC